MKKTYMTPAMLAVTLQHQSHILEASIYETPGNGDTNYGGEGHGPARVHQSTSWDWSNEW